MKIPTQACAWVSPIDQTEVVGLDMAREKSTAGYPRNRHVSDEWLVPGRDGRVDRRASRRRRLDKEPHGMTTQAPAPYLGQFVDADTEVDLGCLLLPRAACAGWLASHS